TRRSCCWGRSSMAPIPTTPSIISPKAPASSPSRRAFGISASRMTTRSTRQSGSYTTRSMRTVRRWSATASPTERLHSGTAVDAQRAIGVHCRSALSSIGNGFLARKIRPKNPDGCRPCRCRACRDEQQVQLRDKQRCPRPGHGHDMSDPTVGIGPCIENIQKAFPATDIDALPFGINEHVSGVGARVDVCNSSAILRGKCAKLGRISECYDDMPRLVIQGHRKIAAIAGGPGVHLLPGAAIDDDDRLVGRIIQEYPIGALLELEALGMR